MRYLSTIMSPRSIGLPFLVAMLACSACNTAPPPHPSEPAPAAPAPASSTAETKSGETVHLGAPIAAPEVALADVAKDPSRYAASPFTTHGTVTAVCQEMGCWMEIKDAASGAHLRMHGHSFFVPKTASGRQARVQATVVPAGAPKACAEPECAPKDLAMLQLDATGVEID